MFNYNGYGNTMPTGTQPYGYPMNNFNMQGQGQPQPQQQVPQINTNKLYVNGIDDVRNRYLPPNSNYIFLDNDKPLLYQKIVDGTGQFEVKAFTITPYNTQETTKQEPSIDLSSYAKISDIEEIKNEIQAIKDKLTSKQGANSNGTSQIGTKA